MTARVAPGCLPPSESLALHLLSCVGLVVLCPCSCILSPVTLLLRWASSSCPLLLASRLMHLFSCTAWSVVVSASARQSRPLIEITHPCSSLSFPWQRHCTPLPLILPPINSSNIMVARSGFSTSLSCISSTCTSPSCFSPPCVSSPHRGMNLMASCSRSQDGPVIFIADDLS